MSFSYELIYFIFCTIITSEYDNVYLKNENTIIVKIY